jgi:hypothetical protein
MVSNITQIPAPRVNVVDPTTGLMSRDWFRYFNNVNVLVGGGTGVTPINAGGTGLATLPTNGQLLIGNNTNYSLNTLTAGAGLTITNGPGTITPAIASTTVTAASYGSATAVPTYTVNARGQLTAAANVSIAIATTQINSGALPVGVTLDTTQLTSGTYTPTLTNVTNITSSTAVVCQYMRVLTTVTVSGSVTITATAIGNTVLRMSLPIASNFASVGQAGGTLATTTAGGTAQGGIVADATNKTFTFQFVASSIAATTYTFSVTYQIV